MAINYTDIIKKQVYDLCSINFSNFLLDKESTPYSACSYTLDNIKIISRTAKITPTKTGQFVTFWKRNSKGITEPYKEFDAFDFLVVNVFKDGNLGQFVFSKAVLISKGILSIDKKEGKRGFRIYTPWDDVASKQALKTQQWQCECFLEIPLDGDVSKSRVQKLYRVN